MERLLKTKEVSEQLNVNPTTVQRWVKYFEIPCETNELGHFFIPEQQLETLEMIKERLNRGFTMKEIKQKSNPIQQVKEKREKMLATHVVDEKLSQLLLQIEQLERKLATKADEVVGYQIFQHRHELDNVISLMEKLEERMSRLEEQLPKKAVSGLEEKIPLQVEKGHKNRLMKIFSF